MLSIVRGGPRVLFLKGDRSAMDHALSSAFPVTMHSFESALDCAGEGQTIVALHGKEDDGSREFRIVSSSSDEVLAALVNAGSCRLETVRLLPRILFFRIFGDKERVLDQIEKDLAGGGIPGATVRRGRLRALLGSSRRNAIAVCFTYVPLNGLIAVADMLDDVLFVEGTPFHDLNVFLRSRGLWYFSEGLENRSWNEMEIRIYDSWGFFMEHAERLRTVLGSLEIGMILGEGWGKDFAHILMSVQIYRLRLFTFLSTLLVKELLIGLEYAENGDRLADFDLYSGRDKISWGGLKDRGSGRGNLGKTAREKLFSRLSERDRERLNAMEHRLLRLRESGNKE